MSGSFACCILLLARACCMQDLNILLQGFPPGPGMGVQGPPGAVRPPMQPPTQQPGQPVPQQSTPMAASAAPGTPGAAAAGASANVWTEHTAPDGRKYYHNKATKQSSWTKPDAMKSPGLVSSMLLWAESYCQLIQALWPMLGENVSRLLAALHVSLSTAFTRANWVHAVLSEMAKPTAQISLLAVLFLPEFPLLNHSVHRCCLGGLAQRHPAPACHSVRLSMQCAF